MDPSDLATTREDGTGILEDDPDESMDETSPEDGHDEPVHNTSPRERKRKRGCTVQELNEWEDEMARRQKLATRARYEKPAILGQSEEPSQNIQKIQQVRKNQRNPKSDQNEKSQHMLRHVRKSDSAKAATQAQSDGPMHVEISDPGPETKVYTPESPIFLDENGHRLNIDEEAEDKEEDKSGWKLLSRGQMMDILQKLGSLPLGEMDEFVHALETNIIPEGIALSLQDLVFITHPDGKDKEIQELANHAQIVLNHIIEKVESQRDESIKEQEKTLNVKAGKKTWAYIRREPADVPMRPDTPDPSDTAAFLEALNQPKVHGLRLYHIKSHQRALSHLQNLYKAVERKVVPNAPEVQRALVEIQRLNEDLQSLNKQHSYPVTLGVIDIRKLMAGWVQLHTVYKRQKVVSVPYNLCRNLNYPDAWAHIPPTHSLYTHEQWWLAIYSSLDQVLQDWYTSCVESPSLANFDAHFAGLDAFYHEFEEIRSAYKQAVSRHPPDIRLLASQLSALALDESRRNYAGYTAKLQKAREEFTQHGYPTSWIPRPPPNEWWNGSTSLAATVGTCSLSSRADLNGRLQIVALCKTSDRKIRPGFTCTGDQILYIQYLGKERANFIARSATGVSLVSSSICGGQYAISCAEYANIPKTLKLFDTIHFQSLISRCDAYGLNFVVVGPWRGRGKFPLILVEFYYKHNGATHTHAFSRSTLGRILSLKEADGMIIEALVGKAQPDMSLYNILEHIKK